MRPPGRGPIDILEGKRDLSLFRFDHLNSRFPAKCGEIAFHNALRSSLAQASLCSSLHSRFLDAVLGTEHDASMDLLISDIGNRFISSRYYLRRIFGVKFSFKNISKNLVNLSENHQKIYI